MIPGYGIITLIESTHHNWADVIVLTKQQKCKQHNEDESKISEIC